MERRTDSVWTMPIVKIEKWEYERAFAVGIARCTARWGSKDAPHYADKSRQEDNRTAEVASALCELAVAKLTNRYWHGHVWHHTEHRLYRNLPDVGTNPDGNNIEVRRLRTRDEVAVRRRQNDQEKLVIFAARVIGPEMREVEVLGYISQKEGWEIGQPSDYDPENTRVVSISKLRQLSN